MNKRLDEIAEFDEHAAEQALSVEGDYICDEAIARVTGARWQFDQNKAQLEAMRAEREGDHKALSEALWRERNLRAALERAKRSGTNLRHIAMCSAIMEPERSPVKIAAREWDQMLAEIEKLERGGA